MSEEKEMIINGDIIMTAYREKSTAKSNNPDNGYKNICALRVAQHMGVEKEVRYLHDMKDLVRAGRKRWTVRSRYSKVKRKSVGGSRKKLKKIASEMDQYVLGFLVRVSTNESRFGGHAMFLDREGNTVVDTAPRQRDRRKMTHCYIVYANN